MFRQNQWFTLSVVLLLALMARLSLAETHGTKHAKTTKRTVTSTQTQTAVSTETIVTKPNNPVELSVGPDLAFLGDWGTGFGVQIGALVPITTALPIYAGVDFGLNFWSQSNSFNPTFSGPSMTGIQLLPSVVYKFAIAGAENIHPYAGLSVGPALHFATLGPGFSSQSKVYFEGLVRPGVTFDISRSFALAAEPKFGLLSDEFIFQPTVYATFSL